MTTHNDAPALPADARPQFFAAVDQTVRLIELIGPDDAARPTPCSELDVAGLVGHQLAVLHRVTYVTTGGHAFDVPSTVEGVPQEEWAAMARERAAALVAAWSDDTVLDRVLHLPFGDVPGRGGALAYMEELVTHAWDLASAIGRRDVLDDDLAALALVAAQRFIPDVNRGQIPFGPVVPVPDDAPVHDRLVAWLGRDPQWVAA